MTDTITIGRVNKRKNNAVNIRIDRSTALGNPFVMYNQSDKERDRVCDSYELYLQAHANNPGSMRDLLLHIFKEVKAGNHVNLQCHCAPKRCHGDNIKALILGAIKKTEK